MYIFKIRLILNINGINTFPKNYISTNSSDSRIFLCILYNNEAEMAYIHVWRLYEDYMIMYINLY